jgi:hypothetical protein
MMKQSQVDHRLNSILTSSQCEASKIQEISYNQVLHNNIKQVDAMENKVIKLKVGALWVNGHQTTHFNP